ncbi:putative cytokinetic ring protein SteA [Corynebacterium occultum]|nr:putative cytokinetic ring protein SteA [Corynebacterium occultum]
MSPMSLFSRNVEAPGLQGTLRDCISEKGMKRLRAGDIAVVNAADITRQFAQKLIEAKPAAVVNLARFTTGAVPNFGPLMLLDADIYLVEGVGDELKLGLRDGKKGRIDEEGTIFQAEKAIGSGHVLERAPAEARFGEAQQGLVDHMEAYFGNTIQFIHSEAPLLIDGLGIPETGAQIAGRKVLVASPGNNHRNQIKLLRNFIREYEPVIIGVDEAADTLVELGHTPDLIVGNPKSIAADTLRSGARVILPAEPDGHAAGLERIQDLGIGAMTFPAATESATDLALLLADYHEAEMIINAGPVLDLDAMFADAPQANPAALLTRAKLGKKLVDANVIANLYTVRSGAGLAWLWALLGILVALAVIVLIVGTGGDGSFVDNLIETWNNIALKFQGWFN